MKKYLLLATSALLLLAGCAKDDFIGNRADGGLTTVTFTASLDGVTATKAAVDKDGNAASVNRCIMEIYYDSTLFERKYAEVTGKTATFSTQVVANRTYTVAFWADHVESTSALATDLYYTTNADGGLQAIALKGIYAGNNDARDAFSYCGNYTIAQGGTACNATLKRPFAQVNVITTDWDKVTTVSSLKPDKVDVTINSPLTKFNAVTGAATADAQVTSLNYKADLYTTPESGTDATLSMDYLFAAADKAVIDIAWKAQHGTTDDDVSHSFTNIPYQRNYRTNIKGNLLTSTGQWNVTVDSIWESSKIGEEEYEYVVVGDIKSANAEIASQLADGQSTISVKFTSQPNDAGEPGTESQEGVTCNSILTTNLPEDGTLNILVEAQTKDLYVGDYVSETSQEVQTSNVNDAVVNINIPANSSIQKLVVSAPSKTVYVNGIEVASGGVVDLDAITSQNTLIIAVGQTVGTLTMRQGGLEIHGTVNAVTIPEGHGAIYVRSCEGLIKTVYDKLEPYIDIDNGYVGEKVAEDNYRIYQKAESELVAQIGTKKYYTLKAAVNAATTGQKIELIKNVPAPAESKGDIYLRFADNVTVDLKGFTLNSGIIAPAGGWDYTKGNAYIFEGNGIIIKNGKINGVERSDGYGYGLYIGNDEDGNITTSNVTVQDVVFPNGGINIYNATNVTVKDCDVTVQPTSYYSVYICGAGAAASVNINGGTYRPGTNGYVVATGYESSASTMSITAGTFNGSYLVGDNTTLSITGGTYDADPSAYVADGYEAVKEGDVWVVSTIKVAKIGETKYETLAAAFEAVQDGQTIELLRDCSFSSTISINKEITLAMNSKDINVKAYGTGFSIEDGGDLTVTGGTFSQGAPWSDGCGDDYNYFLFETKSGSKLTLNNVTTNGYNTHDGAIVKMRGNAAATLNNLDITTDNVIVNSAGSTVQNTLIIDGGTYTTSKTNGPAFYFEYTTGDFNAGGTTSTTLSCYYGVSAGTGADIDLTNVTATQCGNTCVYYCSDSKGVLTNCNFASSGHVVGVAGDVNRSVGGSQVTGDITVNGGTYICHGSGYAVFKVYNSGGKITANSGTFTNDNGGDAAYYDSRNSGNVNVGTDTQPACVILNGGTLTGRIRAQHKAKLYVHGGTVNGNATLAGEGSPIEADGGTFSFDPATTIVSGSTKAVKIAEGYKSVDNGNNTWTIKPTTPTTGTTPDLGDWK